MKIRINHLIEGFDAEGTDIWFASNEFYSIFQYSCEKRQLKLIAQFPEQLQTERAVGKIKKIGDELYLFPIMADDIYCYNLTTKTFLKLNIPFYRFEGIHQRKVMEVVADDKYIYCINKWPDAVIRIHAKTKDVEVCFVGAHAYKNKLTEEEHSFNLFNPVLYGNRIMFPYLNNIVTSFETLKKSFSVRKIDVLEKRYSEIINNTGKFLPKHNVGFLLNELNQVVCYTCTSEGPVLIFSEDKYWAIQVPMNLLPKSDHKIQNIFQFNNIFLVFFRKASWFLKYDITNKVFLKIENPYENNSVDEDIYTLAKRIDDGKIMLYSYRSKCFYIVNVMDDGIEKIDLELSTETFDDEDRCLWQKIMYTYINDGKVKSDNLELLLYDLDNRKKDMCGSINEEYGKVIYKNINLE